MQWEMQTFLCYVASMSHQGFGLYFLFDYVSLCSCESPCGPLADAWCEHSSTNSNV